MTLLAAEPYVLMAPAAWTVVSRAGQRWPSSSSTCRSPSTTPIPTRRLVHELLAAGIRPTAVRQASSLTVLRAQVVAGTVAALLSARAVGWTPGS
jgi:DNA-binding transcriptional LysR family regulator